MTLTTDTTAPPTDGILDAPTLLDSAGAPAPAPAAPADPAADPATLLDKAGEGEKAPAPAVPEVYEISLPEGQAVDAEALELVSPIMKELGLDNEQANKLAGAWPELQAKIAARYAAATEEAQIAELGRLSTQWEAESIADPEIGGPPEVMGPKMALAAKARDAVASPALRELLTATRMGNHPDVIRMFWKVGTMISEGSFVRGDAAAPRPKENWEKLYPDMKSQT
jgi:hypothetical protein